jgi:hypothetical protein
LVALIGAGTIALASRYGVGTLSAVGPGLFPLVMGVSAPDWRGWLCITGGVVAFILLAKTAGLLAATFTCVFIAALGDRATTLRAAVTLAGAMAIGGCALFYYGLHIQLPPFAGWL